MLGILGWSAGRGQVVAVWCIWMWAPIWNHSFLSSGIFLDCPLVSDHYYRLPTLLLLGPKPIKRKKNCNGWMLGISGVGCGEMAMNSGATEIWSESGLPFWWVLWLWVKPLNLSEPHFSLQTQVYEWGPHGGDLEVNEAQKTESKRLGIGIPSIDIFFLTSFPFLLSCPSLFSSLLRASVRAISL